MNNNVNIIILNNINCVNSHRHAGVILLLIQIIISTGIICALNTEFESTAVAKTSVLNIICGNAVTCFA